jgi:hypothetical protein
MKVVRCIPPDKVDWSFREGKFTLGDLARHIATAKRYIFAETLQGNPSRYGGCGRELAPSYDEIISLSETLHSQSREIISRLTDLNGKCRTPDGVPITIWKWMLRAMVEHEAHHRWPGLHLSGSAGSAHATAVRANLGAGYGAQRENIARPGDICAPPHHSLMWRRRRALVITDTELKLMAAAAKMGLSRSPKNG